MLSHVIQVICLGSFGVNDSEQGRSKHNSRCSIANQHEETGVAIATTNRGTIILLSFLLWTLVPSGLLATTRNSMTIDQIAGDAELIFEGEVLSHEARREPSSNIIYTYVTFAVRDVIKGAFSGTELALRFTGGTLGNEIVEISGLTLPAEGERGIYFIESTTRNLLNPLLGWSQGHYLIEEENGVRSINSLNRDPITAVRAVSNIPTTLRRAPRLIEANTEVADGIVSVPQGSATATEEAMTVEQFKDAIRSLLP
jgi:hypothetical protein